MKTAKPSLSVSSSSRTGTASEKSRGKVNPHQFWLMLFGLWLVLLSGVLTPFFGTPGIIQAIRLRELANAKHDQINQAENELLQLQADATRLQKSRVAQEREIRRVLGYAAPNEIIFDFTSNSLSGGPSAKF